MEAKSEMAIKYNVTDKLNLGEFTGWLHENNLQVVVYGNRVEFVRVPSKTVVHYFMVPNSIIGQVLSDTGSKHALQVLSSHVYAFIEGHKEKLAESPKEVLAEAKELDPPIFPSYKSKASEKHPTVSKYRFGPEGVGKPSILDSKPVKMQSAVQLYQPVSGTSPGSRYFVVAMGRHVKNPNKRIVMAMRIASPSLSFRVEGEVIEDCDKQSVLSAAFGDCKKGKSKSSPHGWNEYLSSHIAMPETDFDSQVMVASRSVGAFMASLSIALNVFWDTGMPDVKEFWNKGA